MWEIKFCFVFQFEKGDELRKEFDDLKEQTKKADNDLEEQIRQVDNQARSGIEVVGQQVEEKAKTAHTRYQGLSKRIFFYSSKAAFTRDVQACVFRTAVHLLRTYLGFPTNQDKHFRNTPLVRKIHA